MESNIVEYAAGAVAVVMTLVQVAPIKVNPWSAVAKLIGNALNKGVAERITSLEDSFKQLDRKTDMVSEELARQAAISARSKILRFGDEIRINARHSKEHFDQILRDIDAYENYCHNHPHFENNVTQITSAHIKAVYSDLLVKNDFL